ncbi:hypothetical protein Sjap_026635 [Stephania japonica]|uniref:catalase n=1 Tax=Stephania japonica TaxID=461633 RepID=A0AAP0HED5_9MAGN
MPVGWMVLNKNVDNFFAENEQLAFCPGVIVPSVYYSDDKLLQTRVFSYSDIQRHRLGPNYLLLPANAPKCAHHNNHHEGFMNFMHRDEEARNCSTNHDVVALPNVAEEEEGVDRLRDFPQFEPADLEFSDWEVDAWDNEFVRFECIYGCHKDHYKDVIHRISTIRTYRRNMGSPTILRALVLIAAVDHHDVQDVHEQEGVDRLRDFPQFEPADLEFSDWEGDAWDNEFARVRASDGKGVVHEYQHQENNRVCNICALEERGWWRFVCSNDPDRILVTNTFEKNKPYTPKPRNATRRINQHRKDHHDREEALSNFKSYMVKNCRLNVLKIEQSEKEITNQEQIPSKAKGFLATTSRAPMHRFPIAEFQIRRFKLGKVK